MVAESARRSARNGQENCSEKRTHYDRQACTFAANETLSQIDEEFLTAAYMYERHCRRPNYTADPPGKSLACPCKNKPKLVKHIIRVLNRKNVALKVFVITYTPVSCSEFLGGRRSWRCKWRLRTLG